jgi:2-amino-4-hydroxy-6-hydroxymethyldihydropteridine diphosphokinase
MARVYLSLGSNLGNRLALLRSAVTLLRRTSGVDFVAASQLYETEPWESPPGELVNRGQWFLNCAVAIETTLAPADLLACLQRIEAALGRERGGGTPEASRFVSRPLDIDILFYGDHVISVPDDLHIPHLLLHERAFVLRPLVELAPELEHPTLYRTIRELLDDVEDEHDVQRGEYPARWFED